MEIITKIEAYSILLASGVESGSDLGHLLKLVSNQGNSNVYHQSVTNTIKAVTAYIKNHHLSSLNEATLLREIEEYSLK